MISLATWILWVHLLAAAVWLGAAAALLAAVLPSAHGAPVGTMRRAHFLTSRAMEILLLTGLLNILVRGVGGHFTLQSGFFAMLSLKTVLFFVMAALQIWMGAAWRRAGDEPAGETRRARIGLSIQCLFGAVAALLGLGLRAA